MTTPIVESGLNSAAVMLDAYREELVRSGLAEEAMMLKGLELFTLAGAQCALAAIHSIQPDDEWTQYLLDLKRYVITSLEQSIEQAEESRAQAS